MVNFTFWKKLECSPWWATEKHRAVKIFAVNFISFLVSINLQGASKLWLKFLLCIGKDEKKVAKNHEPSESSAAQNFEFNKFEDSEENKQNRNIFRFH